MKLLVGADEYVARWVESRIKYCRFDKYSTIGVMDGSRLLAGVVYHNYFPETRNIEISIAADSPRWATRSTISALLAYPFEQLGCRRITCLIAASNEKSLKLNLGLGFAIEGRLREAYGDEDMIVTGLLKKDAGKWLKIKPTAKD